MYIYIYTYTDMHIYIYVYMRIYIYWRISSSALSAIPHRRCCILSRPYSINQSKIPTEPHTGQKEADPSTAIGGSKPCVAE